MKERKNIKSIGIVAIVLSIIICQSCDSLSSQSWAPKSPAQSPLTGFEPSSSFSFNAWTHVFESEKDALASESSDGEKGPGPMGMAFLIKEGNYELPFNLFAIELAGPNYVESQFEVLYYDEEISQIRVVEAEGDQVALIEESSSPNTGMSTTYAFTYPGAKVRCGDQIFEIHTDGWYHNGKVVHAFEQKPYADSQ